MFVCNSSLPNILQFEVKRIIALKPNSLGRACIFNLPSLFFPLFSRAFNMDLLPCLVMLKHRGASTSAKTHQALHDNTRFEISTRLHCVGGSGGHVVVSHIFSVKTVSTPWGALKRKTAPLKVPTGRNACIQWAEECSGSEKSF